MLLSACHGSSRISIRNDGAVVDVEQISPHHKELLIISLFDRHFHREKLFSWYLVSLCFHSASSVVSSLPRETICQPAPSAAKTEDANGCAAARSEGERRNRRVARIRQQTLAGKLLSRWPHEIIDVWGNQGSYPREIEASSGDVRGTATTDDDQQRQMMEDAAHRNKYLTKEAISHS